MKKCNYKVKVDGKTYKGEFLLDKNNPKIYDGVHEGILGLLDDWPDEHMYSHVFSTDGSDEDTGDEGVEIHVRTNANSHEEEVTEATAYLWRNNREEDIIENYDTIDDAVIEVETIND